MIQPDFIAGGDHFITPSPPQPVAENSEPTFRAAEGRSASEKPRQIARGVRKARVTPRNEVCVCAPNWRSAAEATIPTEPANYTNPSTSVIAQILEKGPFLLLE
jgi:hypothetical protein